MRAIKCFLYRSRLLWSSSSSHFCTGFVLSTFDVNGDTVSVLTMATSMTISSQISDDVSFVQFCFLSALTHYIFLDADQSMPVVSISRHIVQQDILMNVLIGGWVPIPILIFRWVYQPVQYSLLADGNA